MTSTCIREDLINVAFKAAAEAVNEAILNSMTAAGRTGDWQGRCITACRSSFRRFLNINGEGT